MHEVRLAAASDIETLGRLRWQMHVEESDAEVPEDEFLARFKSWAGGALREGRWQVWVAVVDGSPVGHVYVELIDKVPRPASSPTTWGYLTAFYIQPQFRNMGLGGQLLSAAIEWASSEGLEFVLLWPSERSVSLYKRFGFVEVGEGLSLQFGASRHAKEP